MPSSRCSGHVGGEDQGPPHHLLLLELLSRLGWQPSPLTLAAQLLMKVGPCGGGSLVGGWCVSLFLA